MRILQINTVANVGSTGKIAEYIGDEILKAGGESFIAFGRNQKPSSSKLIQIGEKLDYLLHALNTRLSDRVGFASRRATKDFIKEIDRVNPDIIHLHNLHGYYINIELLFEYIKQQSIPVIWTLHDCWAFTGHCTHFSFVGCDKWKAQCNHCPQTVRYPESWFDNSRKNYNDKKRIFNSIDHLTLVPVSNWLKDQLEQSYLNYPVKVIKNGIDLENFNVRKETNIREKHQLNDEFIMLAVASVWDSRKGLDDLIKFSGLLEKKERIIIIGLTAKQSEKLPAGIIAVEKTENIAEMADYYSEADVFLNLTLEDTYPTTNLEAIACGTPVITYNTGGSVEAVDGETGAIVPQHDFKSLREQINIIKNNKKSFYTHSCRDKAEREFDNKEKFLEYINLYRTILTNRDANTK